MEQIMQAVFLRTHVEMQQEFRHLHDIDKIFGFLFNVRALYDSSIPNTAEL